MPDEAKTPGNEGFVEEIHRIITENEEDPWAGNDYADRMQPEKSFPGDRYEYELRDARLQASRQQREAVEEALEDVGEISEASSNKSPLAESSPKTLENTCGKGQKKCRRTACRKARRRTSKYILLRTIPA